MRGCCGAGHCAAGGESLVGGLGVDEELMSPSFLFRETGH